MRNCHWTFDHKDEALPGGGQTSRFHKLAFVCNDRSLSPSAKVSELTMWQRRLPHSPVFLI
jgi:hypothetical protein